MTDGDLSLGTVLRRSYRTIIARSLLLVVAIVLLAQGVNAYFMGSLEPAERLADIILTLKITLVVAIPFTLYVNYLQARADLAVEYFKVLSRTDPLTGLLNRRAFMDLLRERGGDDASKRYENALLILDLDHFKDVNDRHGHDAGDSVLRQLADIFGGNLRTDDIIARLGGEEFAVALSRGTRREAMHVAQRLRQAVENHEFCFDGKSIRMTVSIGLVLYTFTDNIDEALRKADLLTYQSKKDGRNRITFAEGKRHLPTAA